MELVKPFAPQTLNLYKTNVISLWATVDINDNTIYTATVPPVTIIYSDYSFDKLMDYVKNNTACLNAGEILELKKLYSNKGV